MRLGFGIVLLLFSLWLLRGTVLLYPPGKMGRGFRHPSRSGEILLGAIFFAATFAGAIYLLLTA